MKTVPDHFRQTTDVGTSPDDTFYIPVALYAQSPWETARTIDRGFHIAKHPLYCDLLLGDESAYLRAGVPGPNKIVQHLKERLAGFWGKDPIGYIFTHARPYRFQALLDTHSWSRPESTWFEAAGAVWVDSEGPGVNKALWLDKVFRQKLSFFIMDNQEQALFKKTDSLTVYRGADSKGRALRGLSWSTDRKQAIWFARRFTPDRPWLAEARVIRQHIAARFLRRGEGEVILRSVPRTATAERL